MSPDIKLAAEHFAQALAALGFTGDPEMVQTPVQLAEFLAELRPAPLPEVAPLATRSHDLVVIRDLPFHSLCAHHLLPFFGHCTIAYRPAGRIAGFGWFPRLLTALSRRPQLQERLGEALIDAIEDALCPSAVGVRIVARQLCVELRGARSDGRFELLARRGEADAALDRALQGAS